MRTAQRFFIASDKRRLPFGAIPQLSFAASAEPAGSLSVSQAKAGIKAKLAECFCDRDKAVVLGDRKSVV